MAVDGSPTAGSLFLAADVEPDGLTFVAEIPTSEVQNIEVELRSY